ncbi:hypothetical protein EVAR_7961_1 [Eumeta japonica]|uniref:Uncharacterized protein n=1 Tax=Eumeta variegata TaxID=151549 RepID=A0A4C1TGU3_EUMVA|nr:hypothetical protein EVAR_7961_1 [Eumeta japonica]
MRTKGYVRCQIVTFPQNLKLVPMLMELRNSQNEPVCWRACRRDVVDAQWLVWSYSKPSLAGTETARCGDKQEGYGCVLTLCDVFGDTRGRVTVRIAVSARDTDKLVLAGRVGDAHFENSRAMFTLTALALGAERALLFGLWSRRDALSRGLTKRVVCAYTT